MKRKITIKIILLVLLIAIALTNAYSQNAYYFVQEYNRHLMSNETMKMSGILTRYEPMEQMFYIDYTLWVKDNDKFRLETENSIIFRLGNSLWVYDRDANKAYLYDYSSTKYHLIKQIYLIDDDKPTITYGGVYHTKDRRILEITLYYINQGEDFWKIEYHIDRSKFHPYKTVFYKRGGDIYTYNIQEFEANLTLYDSFFIFLEDEYPGVELIDMTGGDGIDYSDNGESNDDD
jgi:outer membrane lipoprotein-sorting protein